MKLSRTTSESHKTEMTGLERGFYRFLHSLAVHDYQSILRPIYYHGLDLVKKGVLDRGGEGVIDKGLKSKLGKMQFSNFLILLQLSLIHI